MKPVSDEHLAVLTREVVAFIQSWEFCQLRNVDEQGPHNLSWTE